MPSTSTDAPTIVLASGSPRRRELAERIGLAPCVRVSDIPEQIQESETPRDYTRRLARQKAEDVAQKLTNEPDLPSLVLAADTIVILEDEILEKPADEEEAFAMLRRMSGNWHTVQTSFCWLDRTSNAAPYLGTLDTEVCLRELPEAFIANYVATGEPLDKAGAYGIQDLGSLLVRTLEGSYFNVVGLPVCEVVEALEEMARFEVHPMIDEEPDDSTVSNVSHT